MTDPETIPSVLQSLKVRSCWSRILRQIIHPLSYGVLGEHGKDLSDRTPIHPLPRSTARLDNDRCVFREFVEVSVPFESIPSLFQLLYRRIVKNGFR